MSHLLQTINDLAAAWEPAVWRASWQGGIALLLAWTICRLLRRAPAAVHCWIWRLAFLKLLVALLWARPVTLPVLAPMREPAIARVTPAPLPEAIELADPTVTHIAVRASTPAARLSIAGFLMALWAVGAAVGVARLALAWRLAHRWRRNGRPWEEPDVLAIRDQLAERLNLRRRPDLLLSGDVAGPLLLGLRRPAVLLPRSVVHTTDGDDLRVIFAHELSHVKRRDLAWDWLPAVAGALFFFHPLVWLAGREWHAAREIACDELARRAAGASPPEYGRVLLRLIDGQRRSRSPAALAVGLGERAGHFKRRIRAMTQSRNWSKRRLATAGFALAAVTAVGAVPWRLVAQEAAPRFAPPPSPKTAPVTSSPTTQDTVLDRLRARRAADGEEPAAGRGADRGTPAAGRLRFSAQITAATVEIRAPVDGTLKQVSVTEGQAVKQGDTLFQFDAGREQAAIEVAKARLKTAALRLQRLESANKANQVSAQELDDAQGEREVAMAELASVERDLQARTIHAPIAGTTAECGVVAGQYVGKGSLLTTIVGTDVLKAEFEVPQNLVGDPRLKQACRVVVRSQRGEATAIPAKVVYVAPRVEPNTGTVRVKALLDAHDTDRLKAGMFVEVELAADEKAWTH